ncbi:hypothetical protein Ocin01_08936 [Orchesella cincta]|uniref:DUF1917-domain-containing protein n=1 Tax=Orchesella cincta TaxID=48709 RepID=A0A1D2MY59_ORCCI|nr:hypothetical protein Ocin01_08936 [Orchesella cincta]
MGFQEDRVAAKDIVEKINVETLSTLMVDIGSVCKSKLTTNEEIANVKEHPKADHMKPLSFKIPDSPSSTRLSIDNEIFTVNPNFDPDHDPDDYESRTYDLTRKPSKETKYDWIQLWNKSPYNSKISKGEDIVTGKWLIFDSLDKIDETWEKISTAVANGILGCSAKVSTIKDQETRSPYKDNAVICVYTYDHNDENDVMRVRGALRRMGFTKKLPYKTDIATLEGEYRWKTGKRVSKYYL